MGIQPQAECVDGCVFARVASQDVPSCVARGGKYRTTERNLGVPIHQIEVDLRQSIDDARYWIGHKVYAADEIAVRFHHRLVSIHPFPNGNGRWSRLAADLLVVSMDGERFPWGRAGLQKAGETRKAYIDALRAADNHDLNPLIEFSRS
jgi:Fic-DOC domain mobile mystery protein B